MTTIREKRIQSAIVLRYEQKKGRFCPGCNDYHTHAIVPSDMRTTEEASICLNCGELFIGDYTLEEKVNQEDDYYDRERAKCS